MLQTNISSTECSALSDQVIGVIHIRCVNRLFNRTGGEGRPLPPLDDAAGSTGTVTQVRTSDANLSVASSKERVSELLCSSLRAKKMSKQIRKMVLCNPS